MVQRRDLNKSPGRQLADIVADMRAKQEQQRTGSHGVKDMGSGGNIVWSRPEAPEFEVSIRDIDGDLQEAQGRIDEAKADSAEALGRATEAKTDADAAQGRLDTIETVTLPGAVADLEAADQAAQDELSSLDGRLAGAQSDLDAAQTSIGGLRTDLDAEADAREALATDVQADFSTLNSNLTALDGVVAGKPDMEDLTVGNLAAGTVATKQAVIDKLWADGVMAKSVASSAITVSPGNLLPDPNGNTTIGRNAYANLGFAWSQADTGWVKSPPASSNQTKPNAGGDYASYPLEGGRVYRLSFEAKVEGGTGDARYAIYYTKRDGTTAFVSDQVEGPGGDTAGYTPVPANTWTTVNRTWVCPADAVMGGFALQVNNVTAGATRVLIRNPFAGVKAGAVMIENGAITADKINAASVGAAVGEFIEVSTDNLTAGTATVGEAVADKLWAGIVASNEIVANKVTVGGVTGEMLADDAVDGSKIADGSVGAVTIVDGAITTPKLTVTEDMSAALVSAMSLESKKLVVTEEAILNHATLIGDTVVEDINVTGKLVGADAVFTGTVDFENVNVTGLQLVEKLEANSISADKIEGGAFTGETFTGGTFTGGEFRTSDALPGQVTLSDDAYTSSTTGATYPGLRVDPADTTSTAIPPGIGSYGDGVIVDGGKSTLGGSSYVVVNPRQAYLRSLRPGGTVGGVMVTSPDASLMGTYRADGSTSGLMQTSPDASLMRTYRADGSTGGLMQTSPDRAFIQTSREGGGVGSEMASSPTEALMRTYRADGSTSGVMQTGDGYSLARTYSGDGSESGYMRVEPKSVRLAYIDSSNTYFSRIHADAKEAYLYTGAGGVSRYLLVDANGVWVKTYKGGAWKSYNLEETAQDSGWQSFPVRSGITASSDLAWRNKGGIIWFRGHVWSGAWAVGAWSDIVTGLDSSLWPSASRVAPAPHSSVSNLRLQITSDGTLQVWVPANAGTTSITVEMDALHYPTG